MVLLGVLLLVVAGCVCVVWDARGGPRWVRVVAVVTITAGELLRYSEKHRRRNDGRSRSGQD
ncbi:hypothetical protein ACWGKW_24035 [Streptomyces sp. NPDC054766]|uniref:hypothetical protein n=1 Tax=Streptomyces rhizosphaerihabitans TaxID=1266770 RepID=UPI0021C10191|nr:hypothetical protein [Streptomyces rhizosphaerihabitans]MCT9010691.1 hypothetical protein [Streptomyces rhizosphaerihabitans]WRZ95941.1 hypothetical protein OHB54_16960 [Streptomyces sp. NBC_01007]